MNNDRTPEEFRARLIEQFDALSEALPDLDLKGHLSDEFEDICELIAQIEIDSQVVRQRINEKLGVTDNAS